MDAKQLTWIIAGFGALCMVGVLWRMGKGFGPFNLRAVGIVLIATLSSLLAMHDSGSLTAAMGTLSEATGSTDPRPKTFKLRNVLAWCSAKLGQTICTSLQKKPAAFKLNEMIISCYKTLL
jgi:hypothetical protein